MRCQIALQGLFQYLDIFVYVEATIYEMDEANELRCAMGALGEEHVVGGKHTVAATLVCKPS